MNLYESKCDTYNHKNKVSELGNMTIKELLDRFQNHDNSKLEDSEAYIFAKYGPLLKHTTYGSDEYKQYLKEMNIALEHHYSNNRHHPEHHENGVSDMNLIDLIEMIVDWKAASLRHNDGNIIDSIEYNQKRFGYSDELKKIFINTIEYFNL